MRGAVPLFDRESRSPFQVWSFALCLVSTVPLLVGNSGSRIIDQTLPTVVVVAWGVALLLGSVLVLAGLFWRGLEWTGLVIERSGLIVTSGPLTVYALVILNSAPVWDVLYIICVQFAFAIACIVRAVQITRRLRRIELVRFHLETD